MSRPIRHIVLAAVTLCSASTLGAQETRLAFAPTAPDVSISRDVQDARRDTAVLRMDVYRRPARSPLPAIVFYNRGVGAARRHPVYDGWGRTAATRGFVAILPDLRNNAESEDFQALLEHLTANAANLNASITTLASRATTQNAPITLLNHHTGYHGFEIFNNDDVTRAVIDQTLDFVKIATSRRYQTALRTGLPEAIAAGSALSGNYRQAAVTYAELLRSRAEDHRLRLSYGEALLGDRQYAAACAEFEKLKGKGLGPRDLGLPAARACMLKGDADAAIAWLKSIPTRFLPPDVQTDSVFVSLQGRADFRALFPPR
jgi:hypothetical protein